MSTASGPGARPEDAHGYTAESRSGTYREHGAHAAGSSAAGHATYADVNDVSIGERISQITSDFSTLMRQEIALAKAEAVESGKKAGVGAGMMGGAGVAAHLMLVFVSLAIAYALGTMIGFGWGALIVGIIWGVVAAVLALSGKKKFENLGMPQTVDTTQRIPNALKGNESA